MVTEKERKEALAEAQTIVAVKMQRAQSGMSENEQALFFVIEQELGLSREECIKRFRRHRQEEFDRMLKEEYQRNLDTLVKKDKWAKNWTTESFRAFEEVMEPASASGEHTPYSWDARFQDRLSGANTPTIRELFRYLCPELPSPLVLKQREKFVKEAINKFDGRVFEHKFDRKEVTNGKWKNEDNGDFTVKFRLQQRKTQKKEEPREPKTGMPKTQNVDNFDLDE